MPFDSGPETPLGPAVDLVDADWSQDDKSVVIAARRGADSVAILRVDVPTGRSTPIVVIQGSDFIDRQDPSWRRRPVALCPEFRRIGVPGLPDSTFPLRRPAGALRGCVTRWPGLRRGGLGRWSATPSSCTASRWSTAVQPDSRASLVENVRRPRWLDDGSIIVPVLETAWTMAWYRIPSAGGVAVRLGTPPRFPAEYGISANGRRAVALVEDRHTDIYMIRNFGSVLK